MLTELFFRLHVIASIYKNDLVKNCRCGALFSNCYVDGLMTLKMYANENRHLTNLASEQFTG